MPIVSCYVEPLDDEELSLWEKPAQILNRTDKSAKSSAEPKVRIEIDSLEQQSEPEYFLESNFEKQIGIEEIGLLLGH